MNKDAKIAVMGALGLVGKALSDNLKKSGYTSVLQITRKDVDLTNQLDVDNWFKNNKPEYVFLAAAKVGGIFANNAYPVDFGYINGMIELNVLHCAHKYEIKKLLFLGSSCIYPKFSQQPIKEEYLMSGSLEPTNEMYALAKIYGLKLCQSYKKQYGCNFISCMPTNLYGPHDNFSQESGHVIPSLINKFHFAKNNNTNVTCFGTGSACREFLYIDDMADACIFLMNVYNEHDTINVGYGTDISISELSNLVKHITKFTGDIKWDTTKPDGMAKKLLDSSKINSLGWHATTTLVDGLTKTYNWFVNNKASS
jgi:GDP-L-fucose synthase